MKSQNAKTEAHIWLYYADHFYVAARYLYWKGLIREFAFLGAHAIELYFKAYLVHKTDKYPSAHDLITLYGECKKLDKAFANQQLSEYFAPRRKDNVTNGTDWPLYLDATKYPEFLPSQVRIGKKFRPYAITFGTSHIPLDRIAYIVRQNVKIPAGTVDSIKELLDSDYYPEELVHETGCLGEVREAFLRDNAAFTT